MNEEKRSMDSMEAPTMRREWEIVIEILQDEEKGGEEKIIWG